MTLEVNDHIYGRLS